MTSAESPHRQPNCISSLPIITATVIAVGLTRSPSSSGPSAMPRHLLGIQAHRNQADSSDARSSPHVSPKDLSPSRFEDGEPIPSAHYYPPTWESHPMLPGPPVKQKLGDWRGKAGETGSIFHQEQRVEEQAVVTLSPPSAIVDQQPRRVSPMKTYDHYIKQHRPMLQPPPPQQQQPHHHRRPGQEHAVHTEGIDGRWYSWLCCSRGRRKRGTESVV